MSFKDWAQVVNFLLLTCYWLFLSSSIILSFVKLIKGGIPDSFTIINRMWLWSKYPAFVYVCVGPLLWVIMSGHLTWMDYIMELVNIWNWYGNRNQGDDDWKKKLKDKAAEVVQILHGRLVVVPQAA